MGKTEAKYRPEDYGIPAEYRHWPGDTAEDHIGPFFFYMDGPHPRTAFRTRPEHGNTHQTIHGGILATFADYTVCLGASGGEQESSATISLNTEFIAPAHVGELLLGEGEVLRRGHSLVFMRVVVREEGRVILTASSVIKRLRQRD